MKQTTTHKIKKILLYIKRIIYAISVFILCMLLLFTVMFLLNKEIEIPDIMGYTPLIVVSGSMEPTIMTNDVVVIEKVHFSEIKANDIIVYKNKDLNIIIIHRLKEIDGGKLITKGDANKHNDEPFPITDVIGVYKFKIPFIGQIIDLLKKNQLIKFSVFILIIAVFYIEYIFIIKKQDND